MAARPTLLLLCTVALFLGVNHVSHAVNVTARVRGTAGVDAAGGYFQLLATAGVSGISTIVTHKKTVILLDRTDGDNTHDHLPNGQVRKRLRFVHVSSCEAGSVCPTFSYCCLGLAEFWCSV